MFCANTINRETGTGVAPALGVAVSRAGAIYPGFAFAYGYYYFPWQTPTPGAEATRR
ncbi:MAG: hypothetical protein H7Y38_09060 [Armatimonadetes bacterium]|nr:hypothetical protein [Armatimonadota bacterium]